MDENLIRWIVFAAAGLPLAYFVGEAAWKMVRHKCKQYKRDVPERVDAKSVWLSKLLWYVIIVLAGVFSLKMLGVIGMLCVLVFAMVGIVIGVTDFYVRLIPNECLLVILPFSILYMVMYVIRGGVPLWQIPVTLAGVFLVMQVPNFFTRKVVVAPGDVKFWLITALALSGSRILTGVLFFSVTFLVYFAIGYLMHSFRLRSYFPMGGFIACGLVAGAIWTLSELTAMIVAL